MSLIHKLFLTLTLFFSFFTAPFITNAIADTFIVSGYVYIDSNQNGIRDSGEQGVTAVVVYLDQGPFTPPMTTTDNNGFYTLSGTSGNSYRLSYTMPTEGSGFIFTSPSEYNIILDSDKNQDFGIIPLPTNSFLTQNLGTNLYSISCSGGDEMFCAAAGHRGFEGGASIMTSSDNITWTPVTEMTQAYLDLSDVSCPNADGLLCVAVGQNAGGPIFAGTILSTVDGTSWTEASNTPSLDYFNITAVNCPNAGNILCIAMGVHSITYHSISLITSDGITWTENVNLPGNGQGVIINGVTCPNTNSLMCIAVGHSTNDLDHIHPVIWTTSNGYDWENISEMSVYEPFLLQEVACPNIENYLCIAVGRDNNFSNGIILTTPDGSNWTRIQNLPLNIVLTSISCPNTNEILCAAAGQDQRSPTYNPIIMTTTNGNDWVNNLSWNSASGLRTNSVLFGISCPVNQDVLCVAAGITQGFYPAILSILNKITIDPITASPNPLQVNTELAISTFFTDPKITDTHTAFWEWGDGTTSAGSVTEANGSGTTSGTHAYAAAGVYTIKLTVTDSSGNVAEKTSGAVTVTEPTPAEKAEIIVNTVTEADLPANVENSYMANLQKVKEFIEQDKINPAINQLEAFIQKVEQDFEHGHITQEQSDQFLTLANDLLADLN